MIIGFAGLPGTGKTTLAAALAEHLDQALLLNKDVIRHALFGPAHTLYTREQDDFCVETMLAAAAWQWDHNPATTVILDGRTWSRAYQLRRLRAFATHHQRPVLLVECVCDPQIALSRIAADHTHGDHPARDRTPELYHRLAAAATPISGPKLALDTARPTEVNLRAILHHLDALAAPPVPRPHREAETSP